MATDFCEWDALASTEGRCIERIRLIGDDWWLEVKPTPDRMGLEISASGCAIGSSLLTILPRVSNVIHVYSDTARELLVHQEAQKIAEVWKQDESSPMRKNRGVRG